MTTGALPARRLRSIHSSGVDASTDSSKLGAGALITNNRQCGEIDTCACAVCSFASGADACAFPLAFSCCAHGTLCSHLFRCVCKCVLLRGKQPSPLRRSDFPVSTQIAISLRCHRRGLFPLHRRIVALGDFCRLSRQLEQSGRLLGWTL